MALSVISIRTPTPRVCHVADNGLSALVDMHMLNPHRLFSAAAQFG
jgi:hypothetical protein